MAIARGHGGVSVAPLLPSGLTPADAPDRFFRRAAVASLAALTVCGPLEPFAPLFEAQAATAVVRTAPRTAVRRPPVRTVRRNGCRRSGQAGSRGAALVLGQRRRRGDHRRVRDRRGRECGAQGAVSRTLLVLERFQQDPRLLELLRRAEAAMTNFNALLRARSPPPFWSAPLSRPAQPTSPRPVRSRRPRAAGAALTFKGAAYLWATGLEGRMRTLPPLPTVKVDIGFDQVMKNFDGGIMGAGEIGYGRYLLFFDVIASKISPNKTVFPAGVPAGVKVDSASFIGLAAAGYRFVDTENYSLDGFAGVRGFSTKNTLRVQLLPGTLKLSESEQWADARHRRPVPAQPDALLVPDDHRLRRERRLPLRMGRVRRRWLRHRPALVRLRRLSRDEGRLPKRQLHLRCAPAGPSSGDLALLTPDRQG